MTSDHADSPVQWQLAPTDIAQFIRLEQCERYLSLRLRERREGLRFLYEADVRPQAIPPLLTRSGQLFEQTIEAMLVRHYQTINLARETDHHADHQPDNARLLDLVRDLTVGEPVILLQPRLHANLNGWHLRGDLDLLRLERTGDGVVSALIADIKSSTSARMEHRLQVAFYHAMLDWLLMSAALGPVRIETGIIYRGPGEAASIAEEGLSEEEVARQRALAAELLSLEDALLELVPDPASYLDAVRDLVTGPDSLAHRVARTPFEAVPFHLTYKCDGCLYNEFCMKWSAAHDDLSLLPHLTTGDKAALQRQGITTCRELASLKELGQPPDHELTPAPGQEETLRRLATTWPVGPRLDELIHRARRFRRSQGDALSALTYIPSKGHGSLPYCDATHNPNLVRIYIDAQHDHLLDRIYMLGALVVGCEGGHEVPTRRRSIVRLTDRPPDQPEIEQALFVGWIQAILTALVEVAAPDEQGELRAPLHLIFFKEYEQRLLLAGLARHMTDILGATPLYDFVTQLAAFDSPIASFLDQEIRELKNYPMVCQSLQSVAAYRKFDWDAGIPLRTLFRERMFDYMGQLERDDGEPAWYTRRARFNSQIPLEYAYAAWGDLDDPRPGQDDEYAPYRQVTPELLRDFQVRRLEAMEHISRDFRGNHLTQKQSFLLPKLDQFHERARTFAHALDEFVTIERHVTLNTWKRTRHIAPERRVLMGEALLLRYVEAEQDEGVAEQNREHQRRQALSAQIKAANGGQRLTKQQKADTDWNPKATGTVRLRIEMSGLGCSLEEMLALSTLSEGDSVVLAPRLTTDSRLPVEEQIPFTPTPRQLLYAPRARLERVTVERDAAGRAIAAHAELTLKESRGGKWSRGFVFNSFTEPLIPDTLYTIDPDPNDWYGYWQAKVTEGLCKIEDNAQAGRNTIYNLLIGKRPVPLTSPAAAEAQARFQAGLDALHAAQVLHDFEPSKRRYIGDLGAEPVVLVQGPPGTGKSYATAFAIFARLQGALAADEDGRVFVACKTHAATDVLLDTIAEAQARLRAWRDQRPELFARYFDERLLALPLYRIAPREEPPAGVTALSKDDDKPKDEPRNSEIIGGQRWCVVAATPGGIYGLVKGSKNLFGHVLCQYLVLDEASQMSLPEALMAALPLAPAGRLIVVGDHRQMPPIIAHDWDAELRRTFKIFRAYESLFLTLLDRQPCMVKFEESFRLHTVMAEFLRQQIYRHDGIHYHSHQSELLPAYPHADPFVAAVLRPEHPLTVVVHDETHSQMRNPFEEALITPVLHMLARPGAYGFDAQTGLGVVVPHRAQRAALQAASPHLTIYDEVTGLVQLSAVDTVERFQGGERLVIIVSATESDREYLLASSKFLLDPRRLTVALSRAKRKMILIASRSIFTIFSPDEEIFAHAQLWKNLLRQACTERLWCGMREGHQVEVWGNPPVGAMEQPVRPREGAET